MGLVTNIIIVKRGIALARSSSAKDNSSVSFRMFQKLFFIGVSLVFQEPRKLKELPSMGRARTEGSKRGVLCVNDRLS